MVVAIGSTQPMRLAITIVAACLGGLLSPLAGATIGSWEELHRAQDALADDDVETRIAAAIFLHSEQRQGESEAYLREVLALDPDNPIAHNMLGDDGDPPRSGRITPSAGAPRAEPRSAEWYRSKGYRQHRGQWLKERDFRRVVNREQRLREELRQRADWTKAWNFDSRFFRIRTNCSHQVALEIGHALDLCYETLAGKVFDLDQQLPKVPVEVYATQEQFMQASARVGLPVGVGTLGYFYSGEHVAGIRCFYAGSIEATLSTLFHECTHLVVNQIIGNRVPTWSNEGLAVFFEEARRKPREIDLRAIPWGRLWQLHDQLQRSDISLNALVTNETGYRSEHYPQGWALIHFLLFADDGRYRRRFMAYYDLIQKQHYRSNMGAFLQAFDCAPDDVYLEWKRYVLALEPTTPAELIAAAQEAAGRRYEPERAIAYARRALALAPNDGEVLVGYGRTQLYRALMTRDRDERIALATAAADALQRGLVALDYHDLRPRRGTSIQLPLLVHVDHARARIVAEQWRQARDTLFGILEIDPFSSEASAYLALIAGTCDDLELRNDTLADEHLAMADDIGTTHVNLFVRACIARERGRQQQAIDLLRDAAELDRFGFGAGLYRRQASQLEAELRQPKVLLQTKPE